MTDVFSVKHHILIMTYSYCYMLFFRSCRLSM